MKRIPLGVFAALLVLLVGLAPWSVAASPLAPAYTITNLGTLPGGGGSFAADINNAGQIVGYAEVPSSGYTGYSPILTLRAVVWANSAITTIPVGATRSDGSVAQAIDEAGVVTGSVWSIGGSGKRFYTSIAYHTGTGVITPIGQTSINELPPASRQYNPQRLALLQRAQSTNLTQLLPAGSGWTSLTPSGVNDLGHIVGWGTHNGHTRAFLLTPVTGTRGATAALSPSPASILAASSPAAMAGPAGADNPDAQGAPDPVGDGVSTSTAMVASTSALAPSGPKFYGVNIAGAEFSESRLPGTMNQDYIYSTDTREYAYFAGKKLRLLRVPFRWERVQPTALGPLAQGDIEGLRAMLDRAHANGEKVILDLHNYGRYYNVALTRADAPKLEDVWSKLAATFSSHPALYGYELMNEPHDLPEGSAGWAYLAQAATNAIRRHDSAHYVLVPGYSWQNARFWRDNNETLNITDPADKLLYAAHLYFDRDYSGTYARSYGADRAYPMIGADRVQPFLDWLAAYGKKGIVTEYGVPDDDRRWNTVLDNFLAKLDGNANVVGGTYWAAGPWWGTYRLSVEPTYNADGTTTDRPQMAVLQMHPTTAP